jgi:V/A-type H+-transporting ATPase subunit I
MKKYTFLVFHKEYDAFLEQLREAGVVHISQKAEGVADDPKLQELIQKQKELQHIMDQGAPDQLVQERADVLKHIAETEKEAEAASVWGNFSMEKIQALEAAGYQLRFFACQKDKFQPEWGVAVAEKSGKIYFAAVNAPAEIEGCETITLTKSAADISAIEQDLHCSIRIFREGPDKAG